MAQNREKPHPRFGAGVIFEKRPSRGLQDGGAGKIEGAWLCLQPRPHPAPPITTSFSLIPAHLQRKIRILSSLVLTRMQFQAQICQPKTQSPYARQQGTGDVHQGQDRSVAANFVSIHSLHDCSQSGCCDFSLWVSEPKENTGFAIAV